MNLENMQSFSINYCDVQQTEKKNITNQCSSNALIANSFNKLCYLSEKHPKVTLESINQLRKHGELCDVALLVGQKKILAHRIVLSACSPYFKAMFTGELAESQQTEVN